MMKKMSLTLRKHPTTSVLSVLLEEAWFLKLCLMPTWTFTVAYAAKLLEKVRTTGCAHVKFTQCVFLVLEKRDGKRVMKALDNKEI